MITLIKNKKYISLILLLAVALNFGAPLAALAEDYIGPAKPASSGGSWWGGPILFVSSAISSFMGSLFGIVLYIEAQIIDYILTPTNFSFTSTPVVQTGWKITRDIANMFFILILLVIAFATVLRMKNYAVDQLIWKVIVAALLINFSLVIAGFIVDFTQIATKFFIQQTVGNSGFGTITTKLAQSMQILNFYNPAKADSIMGGLGTLGASSVAALVGIILTLVGLVVTVFVFGALAVFLIVRVIAIWFLLIIAPIVWVLWILPTTSSYFQKWWTEFIKWTFFAPIYVFMMYLSLSIFDNSGKLVPRTFGGFSNVASFTQAPPGLTQVGMPSAIFQWILVIAMMFGSLIVAQKFGVHGANYSYSTLKGWGEKSRDWAGRRLRREAVRWTQPGAIPPEPGASLRARAGYQFRRFGAALGGAAVVTPGVRGAYIGMATDEQKTYQEAYNRYKNVDPAILEQINQSGQIVAIRDKFAVKQLLIEKGRLKPKGDEMLKILKESQGYGQEEAILKAIDQKMSGDLIDTNGYNDAMRAELIKRADAKGIGKEFQKFFPKLAASVLGKSLESTVTSVEDASKIYADQLTADVIRELTPKQIKDIGSKGNNEKRSKTFIAIEEEFLALPTNDREQINSVFRERDKNKREDLKRQLSDDLRKALVRGEIVLTPKWEHSI